MVNVVNNQCVSTIILMLVMVQLLNGVLGSQFRAMFVFGDSLVDDGNNNYLNSIAKANYFPYGIDFEGGPTGRFCNGKTFADLLGEKLGIPSPPPYAAPGTRGARILGGVNYASAGAGILDQTGRHYGDRYTLSQQVVNFENTLGQLREMMIKDSLSQYLSRSLVIIVFGSNDYINNYLMPPLYMSSYNYKPVDYANLLLNRYARQLVSLYSVGLRKFLLVGIGPLGCIPNQLAMGRTEPGRCVDYVNQILGTFNQGLRSLAASLNNGSHPGAIFTYGNTYGVFGDILNNPPAFGFNVRDKGCCRSGMYWGRIRCMPFQIPCANRNQYIFWDSFHPTQAANTILAQRVYSGPPNDCYPINIQQMSLLN